jgi:2-methylisocitrate lyase-like PEP mutase family enzyme
MQSMSMMAERLRAMLASPQGIELPGCYDALSAMILERAGFPAIFMSGYGVAASLLGNPDIGLTSLVETAHMARNISNAIRVPLVVDADNGYGNEDNVVRTVRELEQAGAAAIILEDQVFPKRCGHAAGKAVIHLDQSMRKLECALTARETIRSRARARRFASSNSSSKPPISVERGARALPGPRRGPARTQALGRTGDSRPRSERGRGWVRRRGCRGFSPLAGC